MNLHSHIRSASTMLLLIAAVLLAMPIAAQKKGKKVPAPIKPRTAETHLLIVLDCSPSMTEQWQSDTKLRITQQVLQRFVDSVDHRRDIDLGMRLFGHQNNENALSRLEVAFADDNYYRMLAKLRAIVPAEGCDVSLEGMATDFAANPTGRNIVLLITDGLSDCSGDACAAIQQLLNDGTVMQSYVLCIGNGSRQQEKHLACAGRFTPLESEEHYDQTLFDLLRQASEVAHVVINLTGTDGVAYETALPLVFYDAATSTPRLTTLYSCTTSSEPDTLAIDPLLTYDLRLFTHPETTLTSQHFPPNAVTTLNLQIDQGRLRLHFDGQRTTWSVPDYEVIVRRHGETDIVNRQTISQRTTYIAGRYDIEVQTTPPTTLRDVEIRSDATTDLSLPMPGMLTIAKPKERMAASIFTLYGNRMTWLCDLDAGAASERIALMPGEYMIVSRPLRGSTYGSVQTQRFAINTAELKHISL